MKKKVSALLLAAVMLLSLAACGGGSGSGSGDGGSGDGGSGGSSASGKTVLNLWAFTDEVPKMVDKFLASRPDFAEKYEVKTTVIATTDGAYQPQNPRNDQRQKYRLENRQRHHQQNQHR